MQHIQSHYVAFDAKGTSIPQQVEATVKKIWQSKCRVVSIVAPVGLKPDALGGYYLFLCEPDLERDRIGR
jgi:hypothetical protein